MTIEHRNRLFALLATSLFTLAVSVGCKEKPTTDSTPGAAVPATDEKAVPESASGDACPRICETANAKGCPAGKPLCLSACQQMTSEPQCRQQMLAALDCMAGLAPSSWDCGTTGFPELKGGHCEAEQQAVVTCLSEAN